VNRTGWVWTAAILLGLSAASARAQSAAPANASAPEVVTTAPPTGPSSPSSTVTTQEQITDWIKGAPPLRLSDEGADGVISATPDRGVHGEAGAFVSNRGSGAYVAATLPIGKDATLGVAVQDTQFNGRYFHGNSRSLGANLVIGQSTPRPANCPAGVQVGDRYLEPLWVSRMRGAPLADDPNGCFSPPAAAH
jgi:hypothetical protein